MSKETNKQEYLLQNTLSDLRVHHKEPEVGRKIPIFENMFVLESFLFGLFA